MVDQNSSAFKFGVKLGNLYNKFFRPGHWVEYGPSIKYLGENFYFSSKFGYVHDNGLVIADHSLDGRFFYMIVDDHLVKIEQDAFLAKLAPFNFFVDNPESWNTSPHPITGRWFAISQWGMFVTAYEGDAVVLSSTTWPPMNFKNKDAS